MIHLANILIATDDSALGQELLQKIRRHGYDGRMVTSVDAALATAQQEHPDIILVGGCLGGGDGIEMTLRLKEIPGCAEIPVCLTAASPALKTDALAAGIDDVLAPPLDEHKLLARLRPLVRLAIMHAELRQRIASARQFDVDVEEDLPRTTTDADYPLLVVGPDGASLGAALPAARLAHAADAFAADDMLGRSNFDAAVVLPEEKAGPYLDLCAQIRNNPRLFNLPVLMVSKPGRVEEAAAYRHGASSFFLAPVDPTELRNSVLALVRRQRQRWSIRDALSRTLRPATRDNGTGLYNRAFLDVYLANRVKFAVSHGRHLSIAFFRIPDIEGVRLRFGEDQAEHLRLQLAQWITGLLRGEDLTARYEDNEFCVVLPDTPKGEAEIVIHRIAGVLAYTDFAVKDVYQPVKIWVRVGAADLQPEDTVDTLVARARTDVV